MLAGRHLPWEWSRRLAARGFSQLHSFGITGPHWGTAIPCHRWVEGPVRPDWEALRLAAERAALAAERDDGLRILTATRRRELVRGVGGAGGK